MTVSLIIRNKDLYKWIWLGDGTIDVALISEIRHWCKENLSGKWETEYQNGKMFMHFQETSDMIYFKLRWF